MGRLYDYLNEGLKSMVVKGYPQHKRIGHILIIKEFYQTQCLFSSS